MRFHSLCLVAMGAALVGSAAWSDSVRAEGTQFIPVTTYNTGPYAVNGQPFMDGLMDYLSLVNERDGGLNGVKIVWEECETEYKPDRFVECYERLKNKGETGASLFNPLGTGLTYAVIDRAAEDKVPIISLGYGRTDASDGRIFPYIFPLVTNYWSQNTAKIKFIGAQEGGMENLKGKKIANVHHDSAYGKETTPILEKQAERYGFEVQNFPVAHPGLDQKATWLQIRQYRPDWIILRGWGVMNQTAIKEAARVGIPRDKMVGVWWSCAEQDTVPAGSAAEGYICASFHAAGQDFPVVQDILTDVYAKGKGNGDEKQIGTIMWNRGVATAIISLEGIAVAQKKFGNRPLTGEEVRWGLENIDMTDERIAELGATGLVPRFKVTCLDHEGGGGVKFQQWNGSGWDVITDWIETDQDMVRPLIEASAAKYAEEKGITPRDCANE